MSNDMIDVNNNIFYNDVKRRKIRKLDKINNINFEIPKYSEYDFFIKKNYRVSFLKEICKFYKLRISGNKPELTNRIYSYLLESNYAIKIQKNIRRFLIQKYNKLKGPALYNRSLCVNSTDFFTLENIVNIPNNEFFSYKDSDNLIWGFNILSFYNLFKKSDKDVLNPYNRHKIKYTYFNDIKQIVKLSALFKIPVNLTLNNDIENISMKKQIELKCLEIFQYIDELGNYTDINWFLTLNRYNLIKFVRELVDIWQYRAQLTQIVKKEICHPYGNPFRYINLDNLILLNYLSLQKTVLSLIEQFIKKGVTKESCNLGASYVLCALTLVNHNAAIALPWFYESVSNIE
tara:strand:- start:504 stop:1544 length:1041 start_codon:yes stop_codon:yes gene_type:complete